MNKALLIFVIGSIIQCFLPCHSKAQPFNWDEVFALRVVNINEFIYRFNARPTLQKRVVKRHYSQQKGIKRDTLILLLFDHCKNDFDSTDVSEFIRMASDSLNPQFLAYPDSNYYAEFGFEFKYLDSLNKGKLILQNNISNDGYVSWIMTGIEINLPINWDSFYNERESIPIEERQTLNPMDHAIGFIDLKINLRNRSENLLHFIQNSSRSDTLFKFLNKVIDGDITFLRNTYIKYHFLQIDGWIFILENKNRFSLNSGWLISDLIKANRDEKKIYKNIILKKNQ